MQRRFDNMGNQILSSHGTPHQQYDRYGNPVGGGMNGYYQNGGHMQQGMSPGMNPQAHDVQQQLINATNINTKNIEALNNKLNTLQQEVQALKIARNSSNRDYKQDYRSDNPQTLVNNTADDYNERRFNTNNPPVFEPEKAKQTQEAKKEIKMNGENVKEFVLPSKNPFGENDACDWQSLLFDPNEEVSSFEMVICHSILDIDVEDVGDSSFVAKSFIKKDYVAVDTDKFKSELLTPPENLHLILRRLIKNSDNETEMVFFKEIDKLLTNKLNEYLEMNITKINLPSYANDYEELLFQIRETFGTETYRKLAEEFSSVVENSIRKTYETYFNNLSDNEQGDLVPLIEFLPLVRYDYFSTALGLDSLNLGYDSLTRIDLTNDSGATFVKKIITLARSIGSFGNEYYLLTKDQVAYKFIMTDDKRVYARKFVTNF